MRVQLLLSYASVFFEDGIGLLATAYLRGRVDIVN